MDSEEAKSRSIVIAGSFPSGMSSHTFFVCLFFAFGLYKEIHKSRMQKMSRNTHS